MGNVQWFFLLDEQRIGNFFVYRESVLFNFAKIKLQWDAAYQQCCSIGMRLVTMENVHEMEFLQAWKKNISN
jgi:hypothetical protein